MSPGAWDEVHYLARRTTFEQDIPSQRSTHLTRGSYRFGGPMGVSTIPLFVIGIAIVAGLLGLWAYRRATAPRAGGGKDNHGNQAEQWGVRIAAPAKERACPQVRPLLGKEYPMAERPVLPLRDCPFRHQCECRYVALLDRRKEERRKNKERRHAQRFEEDNPPRRSGKDRRKIDVDWETHQYH